LPDVVENIGNPGGALDLFPGGVLDAKAIFSEVVSPKRNVSCGMYPIAAPKCLEGTCSIGTTCQ
jgi:hypothetical protein